MRDSRKFFQGGWCGGSEGIPKDINCVSPLDPRMWYRRIWNQHRDARNLELYLGTCDHSSSIMTTKYPDVSLASSRSWLCRDFFAQFNCSKMILNIFMIKKTSSININYIWYRKKPCCCIVRFLADDKVSTKMTLDLYIYISSVFFCDNSTTNRFFVMYSQIHSLMTILIFKRLKLYKYK